MVASRFLASYLDLRGHISIVADAAKIERRESGQRRKLRDLGRLAMAT